jgi:hypothetical protein
MQDTHAIQIIQALKEIAAELARIKREINSLKIATRRQ